MNCPECQERAISRGGGGATITGKMRRYYNCRACGCDFEVIDGVVRIRDDEPLPFRDRREALRVLRSMVRDDREWFGEVTPETEEIAHQVCVTYLIGNRSKTAVKRGQFSLKRGEGRAELRGSANGTH